MRKFLYVMPAVLVCMLYALLIILAGSLRSLQLTAVCYIGLPILAAVVLRKGHWWGCLFGMAMGLLLFFSAQAFRIAGWIFLGYYLAMGISCAVSCRKR